MDGLIIPFIILTLIVVYLLISRAKFEKQLKDDYASSYDNYKKSIKTEQIIISKDLVGLVFEENGKLTIECIKPHIKDRLDRHKFSIKDNKC